MKKPRKLTPQQRQLLKAAKTVAETATAVGGRAKRKPPAPVTLPKFKTLEKGD